MNIVSQDTRTVYQQRAAATRARRQAAGKYAKPTHAQKAAFNKSLQRGGNVLLTVEELRHLANHPYLTASQRTFYAAQAASDEMAEMEQVEQEYRENPCSYPDYPTAHEVVEGITTGMIDSGEETAEYEDYLIDVEWMRGGM